MLCRAVLTKLKSDNGFFIMEPHILLGKVYWVHPETVQEAGFLHAPTGQHHRARVIICENGTFMPVELLTVTDEIKGEPEVLQ